MGCSQYEAVNRLTGQAYCAFLSNAQRNDGYIVVQSHSYAIQLCQVETRFIKNFSNAIGDNMDMSVDQNIRAMEQCEAGIPVSEKSPTKTTSSFGTKQSLLRSKQTHILNPGQS